MYITINDVIGKKTIDLSYPIQNFGSSKEAPEGPHSVEIAVISMLSENTQYEMTKPLKLKLVDGSEKEVLSKSYTSRELNAFVEGKHIVSNLDNDPRIIETNKLAKVTNMIFKLDELDNTNNLEDGKPNNILFTYYMTIYYIYIYIYIYIWKTQQHLIYVLYDYILYIIYIYI